MDSADLLSAAEDRLAGATRVLRALATLAASWEERAQAGRREAWHSPREGYRAEVLAGCAARLRRAVAVAAPERGGGWPVADQISERDELTLRTLSFIERTTLAEQRRRALHAYAQQARQDPHVAEIVGLMLASRRQRDSSGSSNVIELYPKEAVR